MLTRNNKKYVCILDLTFDIIRGKWKAVIICHLMEGKKRFLELQRITKGVSHKVLNEKLKELEDDGVIIKKVYDEMPPKVEYELTEIGYEYGKALQQIEEVGRKYFIQKNSQ